MAQHLTAKQEALLDAQYFANPAYGTPNKEAGLAHLREANDAQQAYNCRMKEYESLRRMQQLIVQARINRESGATQQAITSELQQLALGMPPDVAALMDEWYDVAGLVREQTELLLTAAAPIRIQHDADEPLAQEPVTADAPPPPPTAVRSARNPVRELEQSLLG